MIVHFGIQFGDNITFPEAVKVVISLNLFFISTTDVHTPRHVVYGDNVTS